MSAETEVEEIAGAAARAVAVAGAAGVTGRSSAANAVGAVSAASAVNAVSGGAGSSWGRRAGVAGATLGLVAAGVAVERMTVNRAVRRKARLALDAAGPYGSLRGTAGMVPAEDGTELYFETEEVADYPEYAEQSDRTDSATGTADTLRPAARSAAAAASGDGVGGPTVVPVSIQARDATQSSPHRNRLMRLLRRRPASRGASAGTTGKTGKKSASANEPAPTVVFTHGYCLNQDVWHFQRAALRGAVRTVYWDQRSHGRSGRAPVGEPVTIDRLGHDLKAVLDAAVPEGPIVLVGHSMGGMTLMALADQYPDFVAERVTGVAFMGTSAGGLSEVTYGLPLPALGVKAVRRAVPGVLKALVTQSALVERGRRVAADLFAGLIKRYSFGSGHDVDPGVARFAERLIEAVPIDVVAEFYPAFDAHEKTAALAWFEGCPSLVLAGEQDLLTPYAHSEAIAAALPSARLCILEDTGHLLMLERPHNVNEALAQLISRAVTASRRSRRAR
jgi:pimeloyl-ACP methyl ester carboxylesterase